MCEEIEIKLRVDNPNEIKDRIEKTGGEYIGEFSQVDFYFDDKIQNLFNSDKGLRIRKQICKTGSDRIFLTYKGARVKSEVKKREEIELEIADELKMRKIFEYLGYQVKIIVKKKRQMWKIGECELCLDDVEGLGGFVEIEGVDTDKISFLQKKLGLDALKHIVKSYAELKSV
jgi:adenylate cyclase class 2